MAKMWVDEVKKDIESGEGLAKRPTFIVARWNSVTGVVTLCNLYGEGDINLGEEDDGYFYSCSDGFGVLG